MIQKLEAVGFTREYGNRWDDGSDHDDITTVYVKYVDDYVRDFCVDYIKDGESENGLYKSSSPSYFNMTFEIDHRKNEHLQSVEGYYDGGIRCLQFKSNLKISEMMGCIRGKKFSLAVDGKKIIGFHGTHHGGQSLLSLGAYFSGIVPIRMDARGGKGGREWDDGSSEHEGVTKIEVRTGLEGIQFIKFEYIMNGKTKHGPVRGRRSGNGIPLPPFEINHLAKEYLVSVDGYYNDVSGIIQALQFKTNINTSEMMGFEAGKKFSLAAPGMKITGFHGFAGNNLNSLGAHFQTLPIIKIELQGNASDLNWDDGTFDGVRKVYVYHDNNHINSIAFDYENGGRVVKRKHGTDNGKVNQEEEFVVNFPNEFITSVGGTFVNGNKDVGMTSLTFKTSKGRTSPTYGNPLNGSHSRLVLEHKGYPLLGFFGTSYNLINGLGAYFSPKPPLPTGEKLEAEGGSDGGASWDDGNNFDGVRKIYIGKGEFSITFIKFLYGKDTGVVLGADHGNRTLHGIEEFELDYPSEYITTVEGSYDIVHGSNNLNVILMLRF